MMIMTGCESCSMGMKCVSCWLDWRDLGRLEEDRDVYDFEAPGDGPGLGGLATRRLKAFLSPAEDG